MSSPNQSGGNAAALNVRGALKEGMARLRALQIPSSTLAAELLLMHALQRDRTWIYTHPEALLAPSTAEAYFDLISRRASGEPTQYLTGKQEFWGLELEVTPAVLIPRPETEHLMEAALACLGTRGIKIRLDTGEPSPPPKIADVGTGSGCLAVALAYELPHAEVFAIDISRAVLEVARRNAARHNVASRIHFLQSDLLAAFASQSTADETSTVSFDLIVSNPPYVAKDEAATLAREVSEHEPHLALFGGSTGTEMYARLIDQAAPLLAPNGILVLELGYNSADHVRAIFAARSGWNKLTITNDLAGIPRVLAAERC